MPFIKKLKIYGFKSFAYKTEIEFREGITCIVGPNGCGKTNIVEALMWVFGEKSSKSMRTENIADIIFAGTEEHKPLGVAEVEVIIDNGDALLPVEYREVSIKRRVYRSGESEFFINKQKCRLKDIHELFADTGIGKGAYSFMEQGKIDMILSTKPEDRRTIFEEAAGISKYKIRRKETMQKLERTENNLVQVNLFLREIKQEREKLRIQAEKAKVYKKLQEQLKQLEVKYYGYRYKMSINTKNEIEKKINKLEDKKRALITKIAQFDAKIEQLTQKLSNYTKNKYEKEKEQSRIEQVIKGNEDKIGIYRKQIEQNNLLINGRQKRIKEILTDNENLTNLYKSREVKIENINQDLNTATKEKELLVKEIEKIDKKIKDNLNLREKLQTEIKQLQQEMELKQNKLREVTDEFVKEIDAKKKEVEGREDYQNTIKKEVIEIVNKIESKIKELKESRNIKEILDEIKSCVSLLKKKVEEIVIHQDEFKNMIFDRDGIYAQKESLDKEISEITNTIITKQSEINKIEIENHKLLHDEKMLNKKLKEIEDIIRKDQFKLEQLHNEMEKIKDDIYKNNKALEHINKEIKEFSQTNTQYIKLIDTLNSEIIKLTDRTDNFNKTITRIDEDINSINQEIANLKARSREITSRIDEIDSRLRNLRDTFSKTEANLQDYEDTLYNEYNVKMKDIIDTLDEKNIDLKAIRNGIEKLRLEIRNLGSVNLLAEEEYEDIDKRYNFNLQQREDLLKAKNDLLEIIAETNKESTRLFLETFNKINENFHYIFRRLFGGGRANLSLENPSRPLESGIIINVQPPGKKLKSISWLSGGERSLSAIGLMFSIFLVKPSPFCALDEIDAALDDENNRRFVKMMKEFAQNTQFIIISHNPTTISNVDYLYGVSMEEKGISKVVSLELRKEKIKEYMTPRQTK